MNFQKVTLFTLLIMISLNVKSQLPKNKNLFEVGDKAPSFIGMDQNGNIVNSDKILTETKILLVFYRGSWCPVCMQHLRGLQDHLNEIESKGVKVIVVSPERFENVGKTIQQTKAEFSILSDTTYEIMNKFGLTYTATRDNVPRFEDFVINNATNANASNEPVLPITGMYIIEKDNRFSWIHFDPDYLKKPSWDEVVNHL